MHFADRLFEKISKTTCIVLGIDPNFSLMPKILLPQSSSPADVKEALVGFSKAVIDGSHGLIPAVKFQSAYYEQFGSTGIAALAQSIAYAKERDLLVILDVKRGDIGATSTAYAKAYLAGYTELPGGLNIKSDLEADCITISPFLGDDSLQSFVDLAIKHQKGLFILVKTSNPGSKTLQDLVVNGESVSKKLARLIHQLGTEESVGKSGYSCIGAVVGATYPEEVTELRKLMPRAIHLVPGVGAQGGKIETTKANFNSDGKGAIIPISRAVTYPSDLDLSLEEYHRVVGDAVRKYNLLLK